MRKLVHENVRMPERSGDLVRRTTFWRQFKESTTMLALMGTIAALGGCAAASSAVRPSTPTTQAPAQGATPSVRSFVVQGVTVTTEPITAPVESLMEQSRQYQQSERVEDGRYINHILIRPEGVGSGVSIYLNPGNGEDGFAVQYPTSDGPRVWGGDITPFTRMIRQQFGEEIRSVPIIVTRSTDRSGGQVINMYAVPLNEQGNVFQYEGGVFAAGASFYVQRGEVFAAPVLLREQVQTASVASVIAKR